MKSYLLTFFVSLSLFCSINLYGQEDQSSSSSNTDTTHPALSYEHNNSKITTLPDPATLPNPNDDSSYNDWIQKAEKEPDNFQSKFINMLTLLGLLIGFMLLASWMFRRMMRARVTHGNTGSAIQVLESRYLSPRTTIYVIDVMGEGHIIAESPTQVTYLAKINLGEETYATPKEMTRPPTNS